MWLIRGLVPPDSGCSVAGEGGLASFCDRYTKSFNRWWDDLGTLHLDPALSATLVEGIHDEAGTQSHAELSERRDEMLVAMQKSLAPLRKV